MPLFGPPNVEKLKAKHNVKGLIKALGYQKSARVRRAAAEALGQIGDDRAVEPLIGALKGRDEAVRMAVAGALGQIGDDRAVKPLIVALKGALKSKDWGVRRAATVALGRIGAPAVEPLIVALKDRSKDMRQAAAEALDNLGWQPDGNMAEAWYWAAKRAWGKCVEIGEPAVEPLAATLEDKDKEVRMAVAQTLGQIGDARAIEPLIAALKDKDPDVRKAAVTTLEKIDTQLNDAALRARLEEAIAAYWTRWGYYSKCIEIGTPAVRPLIDALGLAGAGAAVRILGALAAIGTQIENAALRQRIAHSMIDALTVFQLKTAAVTEALVQMGALAVEPLIAVLLKNSTSQRNRELRGAVVEVLEQIGPPAVEPLIATLRDADDKILFETVVLLLGEIADARAVEPLIAALESKDRFVRLRAIVALGQIGDTRAVGPLNATLKDEDRYLRNTAAEVLAKMGAPAMEPFIADLKDRVWSVRKAAASRLVQLYRSGQIDDRQKRLILAQRGRITAEHVDRKVKTLNHRDEWDRSGLSGDAHFDYGNEHTDRGIGVEFPL